MPKPEGGATNGFGRYVRDERIPRRPAKALADAVRHAGAENDGHGSGKRKEGFRENAETVAEENEELLVTEPICDDARHDFGE